MVVVRNGQVLAKTGADGRLRVPTVEDTRDNIVVVLSRQVMIDSDGCRWDVVRRSMGCPEDCVFVPPTRLQGDVSDHVADIIGECLINGSRLG